MKARHLYLAQALCGLALLTAACVNTDIIETDSHEGNVSMRSLRSMKGIPHR